MSELERQLVDFLEPVLAKLDRLAGELDELRRHRLDAPAWAPGVYRAGAVVQHFLGQYFEAIADTAIEPGDGVGWKRLGLHGFRYRGLYIDGADYDDGDLVARDGAMLLQTAGALAWLTLRGKPGPRGIPGTRGQDGAPGAPGAAGARGADGASLVRLEVDRGLIFAVHSDGRRAPMALESIDEGGR